MADKSSNLSNKSSTLTTPNSNTVLLYFLSTLWHLEINPSGYVMIGLVNNICYAQQLIYNLI